MASVPIGLFRRPRLDGWVVPEDWLYGPRSLTKNGKLEFGKMSNRNRRRTFPTVQKPTKVQRCEPCLDLGFTPIFMQSLAAQLGKPESSTLDWYHQHGHRLWGFDGTADSGHAN